MSDDVLKGDRFQGDSLLGKPIEELAAALGVSAVESERELV